MLARLLKIGAVLMVGLGALGFLVAYGLWMVIGIVGLVFLVRVMLRDEGRREIADGWLDLITWGRAFIANPDLVEKIASRAPWAEFAPAMLSELV